MEGRSIQGSDGVGSLKLQQPDDRVFFYCYPGDSVDWMDTNKICISGTVKELSTGEA